MIASEEPMQFEIEIEKIQRHIRDRMDMMEVSVSNIVDRLDGVDNRARYLKVMARIELEVDGGYKDLIMMFKGIEPPEFL